MSLFDLTKPGLTIAQLQEKIGTETGVSRWFDITQERINAFAAITEDEQFIHVDPEAAKATPFGSAIAHGFLTMSMLSAIAYDALPRIEVDPETYTVKADGRRLTCEPAKLLPLAQRYFLF